MSTVPSSAMPRRNRSRTSSSSETSARMAHARPPASTISRVTATAPSALSRWLTTTSAPALPSARATARPIPELAPVTIAFCPSSGRAGSISVLSMRVVSGAGFRRKRHGVAKRLDHASLVRLPRAGDVECGAVVDRRANERQADRDVHPGFETEDLYRTVALVVIHRDDEVEITAARAEEERVGGQRAFDLDATRARRFDTRQELLLLLAPAEQTALTGVRIDPADRDARARHAGAHESLVTAADGAFHH